MTPVRVIFLVSSVKLILWNAVIYGNDVKLTSRLAGGLCRQFKAWKETKQIQPPLKKVANKTNNVEIPGCQMFKFKSCEKGSECPAFKCVSGSSRARMFNEESNTAAPKTGDDPDEEESLEIEFVMGNASVNRFSEDVPPGKPGSPFGNPNNPENRTEFACISPENPFNKWPGSSRRRRKRKTPPDESVGMFENDFFTNDDDLRQYLKEVYSDSGSRIIGGKNASDNFYPYNARITLARMKCYFDHHNAKQKELFGRRSTSWEEVRRCTGVIFNKIFVLTSSACANWIAKYRIAWQNPNLTFPAFNCSADDDFCPRVPESYVELNNLSDIFVYMGEFQYDTGRITNRQRRSITSVATDCLWSPDTIFQRQSFALLEMFDPITFKNRKFFPLLIPRANRTGKDDAGKDVTEGPAFKETNGVIRAMFFGWGNIRGDRLQWSNYLRYVRMKILRPNVPECRQAIKALYYTTRGSTGDMLYCAQVHDSDDGSSLCRGDVGGPLICETESGHERLCGLLAATKVFNDTTNGEDTKPCRTELKTHVFLNMTSPTMMDRLFSLLTEPSPGRKHTYIYRESRENWQDEVKDKIVKNNLFFSSFNIAWEKKHRN